MYLMRWHKIIAVVAMSVLTIYCHAKDLSRVTQTVSGFGFIAQSDKESLGQIYLVDGGYAASVNLNTGRVIWTVKAPGLSSQLIPGAGPILAGSILAYMGGGGFYTLYGLDKLTGRLKWTLERRSPTLTYHTGSVFLANQGGFGIVDVNANTGKINWEHRAVKIGGTVKRIVYSKGRLYTDSPYVWNASNGQLTNKLSFSPSVVVTSNDQVFFAGPDMTLISLDASDGSVRWSAPNPIQPSPNVTPDDYLAASSKYLVAAYYDNQAFMAKQGVLQVFDIETGKLLWERTVVSPSVLVPNPIAVDHDYVYFLESEGPSGKGSKITAFNAQSGKQVWTYSKGNSFIGPIASIGGVILANTGGQRGSGDHVMLYALDQKTGLTKWKFTLP